MADFTIFYSWQMDAPIAINKEFIHNALGAVVQQLGVQFQVEPADRFTVEQGMKGVPGSPEIATMMFEKIGESAIYVGDVSLVGQVVRRKKVVKKVPNPNVNIEEGFAAGTLGWERVICVANSYFGSSDDQSVDQRNRRYPISYCLSPQSRKDTRKRVAAQLRADLKKAIETVQTYELFCAERSLGQLDIRTVEFIAYYRDVWEFFQPNVPDPNSPVPVLQDLTLWNRCLVRVLELRLAWTNLGVDPQNNPRYMYRWTALGKKVGDLILKKFTPAQKAPNAG